MKPRREVTPETLPAILWCETNVITTELLAKLYGVQPNNIQANHRRNAERFEEGKHFFLIEGDDLKSLRLTFSQSQISPKTRSLILWTERGAARHAKMIETDQAWDAFEKLEDCYFRRTAEPNEGRDDEPSTVKDRAPLLHDAIDMMVSLRISLPNAYRAFSQFAGVRRFPAMTKRQAAETTRFSGRLLKGEATQRDFERIARNRGMLDGEETQQQLAGVTLSLPGRSNKRKERH
ncbi:ORF6N domain-containing protein [Burkholderia contaminans]|uniref:ORF6N domain-containing protein n=1 Tax=Burkholderia contaminans TaxID=488447 RepID=UPI001453D539|nr:ORF6N domain-containing protein [Burkholderia contaminans]VWD32863.1 putative phage-related DNA-binding protein [Burkholderia contaminans]